jgi:hypothetical protein
MLYSRIAKKKHNNRKEGAKKALYLGVAISILHTLSQRHAAIEKKNPRTLFLHPLSHENYYLCIDIYSLTLYIAILMKDSFLLVKSAINATSRTTNSLLTYQKGNKK